MKDKGLWKVGCVKVLTFEVEESPVFHSFNLYLFE